MLTMRSSPGPVLVKACGRPGWRDHDLARVGDDHVLADAERRLAALDDEQLRIGMAVQRRALAGRRVDEEHRHGHVVVGADELVRVLAAVEIVDVDHGAHGPNDTAAGYSPSVRSIDDRKSSDVFVWGNGSAGSGTPSAAHSGPHPSPGCHSTSRPAGIALRTSSVFLR